MAKEATEKDQTAQAKAKRTPKLKLSYADQGLKRYQELLKQKKEFDDEFKPLEAFLIKMGKIEKKTKKKKV